MKVGRFADAALLVLLIFGLVGCATPTPRSNASSSVPEKASSILPEEQSEESAVVEPMPTEIALPSVADVYDPVAMRSDARYAIQCALGRRVTTSDVQYWTGVMRQEISSLLADGGTSEHARLRAQEAVVNALLDSAEAAANLEQWEYAEEKARINQEPFDEPHPEDCARSIVGR